MQPRFRHILVPLETAISSHAAVDVAFEIAVQNKATVSLLHVVQTIEAGTDGPDEETRQFYARSVREMKPTWNNWHVGLKKPPLIVNSRFMLEIDFRRFCLLLLIITLT